MGFKNALFKLILLENSTLFPSNLFQQTFKHFWKEGFAKFFIQILWTLKTK